jgi:hypothetical protein
MNEASSSPPTSALAHGGPASPDDWDFEAEVATLQHDRRAWVCARAAAGGPSTSPARPPEPPALPLPLRRPRQDDAAWLASLAPETRAVLEAARARPLPWPRGARVPGAVAQPLQKIPSLAPRARRAS